MHPGTVVGLTSCAVPAYAAADRGEQSVASTTRPRRGSGG